MNLSSNDLYLLCQCAISAACQAGHLIESYAGKALNIKTKDSGRSKASQIVTEADIKSQDLILKTIEPASKIFDLALLTEESVDDNSRFEKDYFWCIDPLDGTLCFTETRPGYAVSIALVSKEGIPMIGVIYDPVNKTLYHAIKGQGAFINGKRLAKMTDYDTKQESFNVFFDRSFFSGDLYPLTEKELEVMTKEIGYKTFKISYVGGSVISAIETLKQFPACYFKYPREADSGGCLWDYASTSCVFHEVGAQATDIYGSPLDLNREDSTFMNHKGFVFASEESLSKGVRNLYSRIIQ